MMIGGLASQVRAQTDSRFAAGAEFGVVATDRASREDYAHAHAEFEPLWRFGTEKTGWGFHWGLNWYAVDIDRPIGGVTTELGEVNIRPIMAGYGYTQAIQIRGRRTTVTADLLGGYAFSTIGMTSVAVDAYSRVGARSATADASNTFVLKPEVGVWYDINKSFGLNVNAGYMIARPDVTITSSAGSEMRTARADQFIVKVGLAYSIF
jgi:hypothetical protein